MTDRFPLPSWNPNTWAITMPHLFLGGSPRRHPWNQDFSSPVATPSGGLLASLGSSGTSGGLLGGLAKPADEPPGIAQAANQIPMAWGPPTLPHPSAPPTRLPAALPPRGWNASDHSLWDTIVGANRGASAPPVQPIDDPFARAALRTRESVRPEGGRLEGAGTRFFDTHVPRAAAHVAEALATLPQRALTAAGDLQRTGEYDPAPVVEAATLMVGSPLTPAGALGSAARRPPRLPMDEASRMARAKQLGYADEPFYRGEATGRIPDQYRSGAHFSRDKEVATAFARRGGQGEPREFRLDLSKALKDYEPGTAEQYGRVVASAMGRHPKWAADLVQTIAPGHTVDSFLHLAKTEPNLVMTDTSAHLRQMLKYSPDPDGILKRAGFDAFDSGRDVQKFGGSGIRLKEAAFDPARRDSRNILASIPAGVSIPPILAHVYADRTGAGLLAHDATPESNQDAFWDAWRRGDAL